MTSLAQIADPAWLNSLFNSNMEGFFDCFNDSDDLMEFARWRKERSRKEEVPIETKEEVPRKGPYSNVAFVVLSPNPTFPFLFMAHRIILVHGRSPYFNESLWFNRGIEKALEMGSKWVIVMSDDLYGGVDAIWELAEKLERLDNQEFDTVWVDPRPDFYHSYPAYLAKRHPLENVLGRDHLKLAKLYEKFGVETVVASETPIRKPLHYWLFNRAFPRPYVGPSFKMTSDFAILSAKWCKKQGPEVLCELFSGWEDLDLSQRLRKARSTTIDWRIGSSIGSTIKPGLDKALRETFNLTIFNRLLRDGKYAT